jgi:polar amino acid transport system permease protein
VEYQFQFDPIWAQFDALLWGAWYTLKLSALSGILGFFVGLIGAVARRSNNLIARSVVSGYVELIRNTPFIVQLFFVFFGLPSIGLQLSADQAALLAMTINIGAYFTEIIRSGLDAADKGQIEAATALGLPNIQTFFLVVLKPALSRVYPALTGQFILVMQGSAVVSQISAEDLTFAANFIQSRTFRAFEVYFVITGMYLALALGMKFAFARLERILFRWRQY